MELINLKNSCGLVEIQPTNEGLTWSNNQPDGSCNWERLDYVLANTNWFNSVFNMHVSILERVASDHSPLLLNVEENKFKGNRIF